MEMCLQMNLVYQAVIEEKIQEVELLIAQNKEQQDELMWELAGRKVHKTGDSRVYPLNLAIGHFLKPYFKDKVSGVGPPANQDVRERAAQGIKSFEELANKQWKSRDKEELRCAVLSDSLQRMLQPKLLKLEYLNQKHDRASDEIDKKILTKQIRETEREIDDINQLPEEALLGQQTDEHDWEKISKINFEGVHSADKLKKIWQNSEHPHISKKEWEDDEVIRLQEIAAKHNYVNWLAISKELGTNRSAFQCLQKYQHCNKEFKRKEFTKEEDEMLTQLVQQMRVGNHIPYKKISYFMEGRDAMQLLYRWSKSLDPNLKKGYWSKSEDELLLKAISKHGERNWYKIRLEVPGRTDMQCRERYIKGLHADLKKGKWSTEEKQKLVDLVEKYGVGRWTKIASELTHRTGSQCLSKWKAMIGYKPKTKRCSKKKNLIPHKRIKKEEEEDESENETSSEDSDYEMELMEDSDKEKKKTKVPVKRYIPIPNIDRWVPRRQTPEDPGKTLLKHSTLLKPSTSLSFRKTYKSTLKKNQRDFQFTTILKGIAYPHSTDMVTENPEELLKEARENGRQMLQIREEDVRLVLKQNTKLRQEKQIQRAVVRPPQSSEVPETTDQSADQAPNKQPQVPRKVDLYKDAVDRKLLLAVTPWVGNIILPLSTSIGNTWRKRMQADVIRETVYSVTFTSTPAFTLFIQLFRIDADGCLKMIQERKYKQLSLQAKLDLITTREQERLKSVPPLQNRTIGTFFSVRPPQQNNQRIRVIQSDQRPMIRSPVPVKTPAPIQKPKTVYELLREKRMAKKAAQKSQVIPQKMLLVQPQSNVTSQQPIMMMPMSPATGVMQLPTNQIILNQSPSVGCQNSSVGGINMVALGSPSNMKGTNSSNSAQAMPTSPGPIRLITSMLSPAGTPHGQSSNAVPITWMVTPQGLIPVPLQTLGLPNQIPQITQQSTEVPSVSQSGKVNSKTEPSSVEPKVPDSTNGSQSPALSKSLTSSSSENEASSVSIQRSPPKEAVSVDVKENSSSPPVSSSILITSEVCSSQPIHLPPSTPRTSNDNRQSETSNPSPLTPNKYPVVKITKLLSPSHPNYPTKVLKLIQTPAPKKDSPTTPPNTEKKTLDVSLLSMEDEAKVKEWLQGKEGVQTPSLQNGMAYLPPSICNLKTLSKLLQQKTALEESAFKLVPTSEEGGEMSQSEKQEILHDIVDQRLKDNPAYILLKQRFLSAFTLPAFLAILPPKKSRATAVKVKREASDEDSDDSTDKEGSRLEDMDEDMTEDITEAPSETNLHEISVPAASGQRS
ncbi:snRNA-activating protein complex subunit 4 isoform 2-T2 [Discoglossus pictus]